MPVRKAAKKLISLILMTAVLASIPAWLSVTAVYADDGPQSSFEYKKYDEPGKYINALKKTMYDVYKDFSGKIDDSKTLPIPGLVETCVYADGKVKKSSNYVPQGLCLAGDYMLVTAYDVKKKLNTVIYAVDADAGKLVSTLTLPNKYHAGGIAFDGENIWMTGDTSDKYKGKPFVQYMTYDTFVEHIKDPVSYVSEEELSDNIYIKNKPSFLECDNGILWVGTYAGRKNTSEGYLNGYEITGEPGNRRLNTIMYSLIAGIDSSAQGADIENGYLYVSSSYKGTSRYVKSSFITKYDLRSAMESTGSYYVEGREVSRVEVPKMNEEIIVDGATILINFESGASYWRMALINTDRILAVDEKLWGRMR